MFRTWIIQLDIYFLEMTFVLTWYHMLNDTWFWELSFLKCHKISKKFSRFWFFHLGFPCAHHHSHLLVLLSRLSLCPSTFFFSVSCLSNVYIMLIIPADSIFESHLWCIVLIIPVEFSPDTVTIDIQDACWCTLLFFDIKQNGICCFKLDIVGCSLCIWVLLILLVGDMAKDASSTWSCGIACFVSVVNLVTFS